MQRDVNLFYIAKLSHLSRIEYYLEITSEIGQSVNIGDPNIPFIIEKPQIQQMENVIVAKTTKKEKWKKRLAWTLGIIVAILGGGWAGRK